jgi:hypothetical protein
MSSGTHSGVVVTTTRSGPSRYSGRSVNGGNHEPMSGRLITKTATPAVMHSRRGVNSHGGRACPFFLLGRLVVRAAALAFRGMVVRTSLGTSWSDFQRGKLLSEPSPAAFCTTIVSSPARSRVRSRFHEIRIPVVTMSEPGAIADANNASLFCPQKPRNSTDRLGSNPPERKHLKFRNQRQLTLCNNS